MGMIDIIASQIPTSSPEYSRDTFIYNAYPDGNVDGSVTQEVTIAIPTEVRSPIPDNAFGAWMVYSFGSTDFKDVYDSGYASYGVKLSGN